MKKWSAVLILLLIIPSPAAQAATLHGTIYDWADFEKPLKNTIVEVNSTPAQYVVSTMGAYSFNLSPGSYLIRAKFYRNNILELTGEEVIRIEGEGDYIHDLMLFPPVDSEYEYLGDINLTTSMDKSESNVNYYITVLILIFSAIFIFYFYKKRKTSANEAVAKEPDTQPPEKPVEKTGELPEDLNEIYELILKKGGRVTQKDLRKEVKYGEAKVSLMLDDLEERGLIKKIKKGRANIIIAEVKKQDRNNLKS